MEQDLKIHTVCCVSAKSNNGVEISLHLQIFNLTLFVVPLHPHWIYFHSKRGFVFDHKNRNWSKAEKNKIINNK